MTIQVPSHEELRLSVLRQFDILDTSAEQAFDDITALAQQIAETPMAMFSIVDHSRQWFKSKIGLDASETPRSVAFCAHAIQTPDKPLHVYDATQDPRFAENPLVVGNPNIRFYLGAPLVTRGGTALGTVCVLDTVPRTMTDKQIDAILALSRVGMAQMELRRASLLLRKIARQLQRHTDDCACRCE